MGWNDSRGVLLSWNGRTPGESVLVERFQGSPSVLVCNISEGVIQGWYKDCRGVPLSWDIRTPVESFCLGINESWGVILS